jgi:hypothetical protein
MHWYTNIMVTTHQTQALPRKATHHPPRHIIGTATTWETPARRRTADHTEPSAAIELVRDFAEIVRQRQSDRLDRHINWRSKTVRTIDW